MAPSAQSQWAPWSSDQLETSFISSACLVAYPCTIATRGRVEFRYTKVNTTSSMTRCLPSAKKYNKATTSPGLELSVALCPRNYVITVTSGIPASLIRMDYMTLTRLARMRCLVSPFGQHTTCLSRNSFAPAEIPH